MWLMSGVDDVADDSNVECVCFELPEIHTHRRRQSPRDRRNVVEAIKSMSLLTAGLGCSVDAMEARQSAACNTLASNEATRGELTSTNIS